MKYVKEANQRVASFDVGQKKFLVGTFFGDTDDPVRKVVILG